MARFRGNEDMQVAVVGAGPSGLIAALLLARAGVAVTVYEARDSTCALPQAHVVNTRTGEILRELGLFDQMVAAAANRDHVRYVTWSDAIGGTRYGRLPYQGDAAQYADRLAASAARTINIGQDAFERVLCRHFEETHGPVAFGHKIVGITEDADGAGLSIETVDGNRIERSFDYVLACDGASSTIRRALDIPMEGPPSLARMASAYFRADLLSVLGDDVGPVHFIANAEMRGVIIGFDLKDSWALMCPMSPGATAEDFPPEMMMELIRRAVGDPQLKIELTGTGSWNMSAQVAAEFRKGRFFLVGDSAHRFPPTGGLGLNTGVQDAHNLAWKLAFVAGGAPESLLDSYAAERRPIALRNCQHSVTNSLRMREVDATIAAAMIETVDPARIGPAAAALPGWSTAPDLSDDNEKRSRTQAAIDDQRPHFNSLMMEIGFRYGDVQDVDGERHVAFSPLMVEGGRLPHFWVDEARTLSSHDLLARDCMTLLLCGAAGEAWSALAGRLPVQPVAVAHATLSDALTFEGAALVRPDGHIAWFSTGRPDTIGEEALAAAVHRWVGIPA